MCAYFSAIRVQLPNLLSMSSEVCEDEVKTLLPNGKCQAYERLLLFSSESRNL